jgi:hypothetical protein
MIHVEEPRGLWELFTKGEQAAYRLGATSGYEQACREILAKWIQEPVSITDIEEMLKNAKY